MRAVGDLILEQRKHAEEETPEEPKPQGGNVPPARTPLKGDETVRVTQDNQPRLAAVRDIAAIGPARGMIGGVVLKAGGRSRQLAEVAAEAAEASAAEAAATVAPFTAHLTDSANPHSVTKAQVGLGNVDNTADADKPVSTAQAAADAAILAAAKAWTLDWSADVNGTITTGGVAQPALAANPLRSRLRIENPSSADEELWISLGGTAVVGVGDPIWPGGNYDSFFPPTAADKLAVSVIAATTGHAYKIKQKVVP